MTRPHQRKFTSQSFVGFGDFVRSHREEILRSWIAAVDRNPKISTSDNLTYTQLLDHLPELCAELAALLQQPNAEDIKSDAKRDAKAHGWKRWRQGYKLDELIREICLVRRDFIDNWLDAFAAKNPLFDREAQNGARRVVEMFFENVIIEATGQFVEENHDAIRQVKEGQRRAGKASPGTRAEFIHFVSHQMREPLGPLLFALEVLKREECLSPLGLDMVRALKSGIQQEARAIEELLDLIDISPLEDFQQT